MRRNDLPTPTSRYHLLFAALVLLVGCASMPPAEAPSSPGYAMPDAAMAPSQPMPAPPPAALPAPPMAGSPGPMPIAAGSEENQPHGNLSFWVGAIDRQLRRTGFVAAAKPAPVTNGAGETGTLLRYDRENGGRPDRYWIAVFVRGDEVWCVEAGGDADRFDAGVKTAVERAIASMTPG